ncbi:MAG TPA: hypothetical protein VD997_00500 [Phycisphaerales bacterium]|nr:hypothetical protein [Phycisphaerales bacterium]
MKLAAASLALLAAAGLAQADVTFYSNDFEAQTLGPEWSSNSVLSTLTPFTRYNGRYSNGYTQLTLGFPTIGTNTLMSNSGGGSGEGGGGGGGGGGETHLLFRLTFDFFAIDSWDGDANYINYQGVRAGPDWLDVNVNQTNIFRETFNNRGYTQTFREPDQLRVNLGYVPEFQDAIYRSITLEFTATPNQPLVIRWQDSGLQGLADESWGIDNVNLSYTVIPAPASLTLAAGGLALGARRRRR